VSGLVSVAAAIVEFPEIGIGLRPLAIAVNGGFIGGDGLVNALKFG
jgi:hypothetical protein